MTENFRQLRRLGRKIDSDIEYLEKTWASPHLLIAGYSNSDEESLQKIDQFFDEIKDFREEIRADQEIRKKFISNTEDDIKKTTNFYEQMKKDCEDVEILFSDWGYTLPLETLESLHVDESETESSILTPEQMNDTPSPKANYDERNNTDVFFTPTINTNRPTSIATPVIKSLASEMKLSQQNGINISSSLDHPTKDFLTPYYGRRIK